MTRQQKTFCRICDVGCGMIAEVEDERIRRLRGNPDHVVSQGYSCPKGRAYRELVHSPDRLTAPKKRLGPVSDNRWEETNWNSALTDIGSRLRSLIEESGPESVAIYVGNGAGFGFLHPFYAQGFLMGLGSPNLYGSATQDCSNKFAVALRMYGFPMLQPVPDFEHARCFVILGGNPAATKMSFRGVPNPVGLLKKAALAGCRIVHVDPRRTEAADAAGEHWPIRPDTDVFFLLAFLGELFRIDAVDESTLDTTMRGLGSLKAACEDWTAERQALVTGISAESLHSLAATFRDADGASFYLSTGLNMGRNGALCGWLVEAINAVSGNLDKRGGTLVGKGSLMDFPKYGSRVGAMMGKKTSRLGQVDAVNEIFPGSLLADEILTPGRGKIRALLVAAGNPLLTLPDTAKTERAFRDLDLLVTVDIVHSATSDFAHWVLPGTTPYEHPDLGYLFHSMMGIGHRRLLQYTDSVVPPPGIAKDELWIWQELCKATGGRFFGSSFLQGFIDLRHRLAKHSGAFGRWWSFSHEKVLDCFLRFSGKPSVRRMRRRPDGVLLSEPPPGSFLGKRVRTHDRKVNLAPQEFLDALPKLEEEYRWEQNHASVLKLVNQRGFRTQNSFLQSSPTLMKGHHGSNHLHVSPVDAQTRGLLDGHDALVWSEAGCLRIPVKISHRMSPGTVAIPFGWGQQRARNLGVASTTGGANVNWLFPSGQGHFESLSLMAHLSGLPVEAAPITKKAPVVILAGGESRRFGNDKTREVWNGRSLVQHVVDAVEQSGRQAILSIGGPRPLDSDKLPRLVDPDPEIRSPVSGLLAAARVLPSSFFVAAADSPLLNPAVLDVLEECADTERIRPVVFLEGDRLHPFPGLYHAGLLDPIEEAFDKRRFVLTDLLKTMNPITVSVDRLRAIDPQLATFRNINTPEDLLALS